MNKFINFIKQTKKKIIYSMLCVLSIGSCFYIFTINLKEIEQENLNHINKQQMLQQKINSLQKEIKLGEIKDKQNKSLLEKEKRKVNELTNKYLKSVNEIKKLKASKFSQTNKFNTQIRKSRGCSLNIGKRVMVMKATAYHTGEPGVGTKTASGTRAIAGRTIAVDRRIIPLGSRVYLEFPTLPNKNGYYIAEDVGGAIKGDKIDVYVSGSSETNNFGLRKCYMHILE